MAKPSAILAQYLDGELTRAQAAEQFREAEWNDQYTPASMQAGGDYDGGTFEPESFATVIYVPASAGQLSAADYAAFQPAFAQWQVAHRRN